MRDDADRGVLSLIDRGLIPQGALLSIEPSPISHQMAVLHVPHGRSEKPVVPGEIDYYRKDNIGILLCKYLFSIFLQKNTQINLHIRLI